MPDCFGFSDNSTQMLYFNVTVDESAKANITQLLQSFGTDNFFVDNLEKTTGKIFINI